MSDVRYFLRWDDEEDWREVTVDEFVRGERRAGFRNTMGRPDLTATGGFHGNGVSGRIRYGMADEKEDL